MIAKFADWWLIAPHLALTVFAVLALLWAAIRGERREPNIVPGLLAALGCGVAAYLCATNPDWRALWHGMFIWDAYGAFFCVIFTLAAMLASLATLHAKISGEFTVLLLISTIGLMFMVCSGNLLMLYLSLEVSTICLFVLTAYFRGSKRSNEAAVKYLIAAGSASCVMLFGVSWVFGAVGSTDFHDIARYFSGQVPVYAWTGALFIVVALGFKIAAAPFHLWAPDVYEGAPSVVTAYLSTASKAAGFAVLVRVLVIALPGMHQLWIGVVVALAVLTMVVGNLVAIVQQNVKRLLAYSGIAQAGFLLIAVAAGSHNGRMALGLYLLLYLFANVGAFLCVYAVSEYDENHALSSYNGLSRRAPRLAFAFLIFLLSLAGIPPLAGFVGKFYVFSAGMEAGLWWLVFFGAVASTVSLYYYLIVAKRMYIDAPQEGAEAVDVPRGLSLAIGLCVAMTAIIGLYPAPWVALGERIAVMLR